MDLKRYEKVLNGSPSLLVIGHTLPTTVELIASPFKPRRSSYNNQLISQTMKLRRTWKKVSVAFNKRLVNIFNVLFDLSN